MVLRPKLPAFAILCSLVALAQPGAAQIGGMITGHDVDRVVELASAYGPATRRFDDAGDGPWIRAEMDDVVYTITFLNCTGGENCASVQLRAWWESGGVHTLEQINAWNRDRRFGAAYLDADQNATVEFDVNLAGGVTAANFDDTLQWWQVVLRGFVNEVIEPGYGAAGSGRPALSK